jgi:hypothetical protein
MLFINTTNSLGKSFEPIYFGTSFLTALNFLGTIFVTASNSFRILFAQLNQFIWNLVCPCNKFT